MPKRREPSPRVLRRLIDYCPKTGKMTWKERPVWMFKTGGTPVRRVSKEGKARRFNKQFAGQPALNTAHGRGYLSGEVFGISCKAHRVAWAIFHGQWPSDQLDHINGDRSDNRISNLRSVDQAENMKNRKRPKHNTTGHIGVYRRSGGKWCAEVISGGNAVLRKHFDTYEEACAAQEAAASKAGFHKNHGRAA